VSSHHLPAVTSNMDKDLNVNTANQLPNKSQGHPTSAAPGILAPRHNFVNKRVFGRDLSNLPMNSTSGNTSGLAPVLESIGSKQPQLVV
jgi:hypothetical protein